MNVNVAMPLQHKRLSAYVSVHEFVVAVRVGGCWAHPVSNILIETSKCSTVRFNSFSVLRSNPILSSTRCAVPPSG